jgi:hypothetical protein
VNDRPRDWDELERLAGVKRTVPKSYTRRDVEVLTRRRLKGPFWRFRRR